MYEWVKSLTGSWGPPLLAWYQANSWINIPLLVYGAFVALAWRSYDQIEQRLVEDLLAGAKGKPGKAKLPGGPAMSWEAAVAGLRYPWLARRGYLRLHRCTPGNAEKLLNMHTVRTKAQLRLERMK